MRWRYSILIGAFLTSIAGAYSKTLKTTGALIEEVRVRWPHERDFIMAPVRTDGAGARPLSEQAASVAKLLSAAGQKKISVAVYGYSSAATRRVAVEALREVSVPHLKHLLFVFCGAPADRETVERQVVAKGGTFAFIKFND